MADIEGRTLAQAKAGMARIRKVAREHGFRVKEYYLAGDKLEAVLSAREY